MRWNRIRIFPLNLGASPDISDGASGSSNIGADATAGGSGGLLDATSDLGGAGGTGGTGIDGATSDATNDGDTGSPSDAGDARQDGGAGDAGDAGDACVVTNAGVEQCDGLDNDCNGTSDDGAVCGNQCAGATYGGHAYAFCSTARTFADAATDCQSKSMRLARIDDAAENEFLADLAFAGLANAVAHWPWFGASDIATPVQWAFVDGTVFWSGRNNGSAVGGLYTNWASASPSDGSGTYCATLSHGSSLNWVDRTCSGLQPYLCESY